MSSFEYTLTSEIAVPILTRRFMYPNALISFGLISSDDRTDSTLALSVNRSEMVILRTRMGFFSSLQLAEGIRRD